LLRETYHHFATSLLQERQQALLPPYGFLALFRAEAHSFEQAQQFLAQIKQLANKHSKQLSIWGPVPAPMPRRAGRFRVQLLFQANQRSVLHHYLSYLLPQIEKLPSKNTVRWSLDVDPLEMS
jgi:primosomal protein N' (replication factor Y)